MAVSIAMAESHCRKDAINHNKNGSIDEGVFQINSIHKQSNMMDYKKNISYAYRLYKGQGWRPWSTYINGSYKKFISSKS